MGRDSEKGGNGTRGGAWEGGTERKEREASGAILSLIICLPQLILIFFTLQRGNLRLLVMFGILKLPIEIGIPFSFDNFRAMVIQFGFKKSKFGEFESSL